MMRVTSSKMTPKYDRTHAIYHVAINFIIEWSFKTYPSGALNFMSFILSFTVSYQILFCCHTNDNNFFLFFIIHKSFESRLFFFLSNTNLLTCSAHNCCNISWCSYRLVMEVVKYYCITFHLCNYHLQSLLFIYFLNFVDFITELHCTAPHRTGQMKDGLIKFDLWCKKSLTK